MRVTTVPVAGLGESGRKPPKVVGPQSPVAVVARYAPRHWFLVAPIALIVATLLVFKAVMALAGGKAALLAGFPFYWMLAGVVLPILLIGREGYASLFATGGAVRWTMPLRLAILALAAPVAFGFLFVFPLQFPTESSLLLPGIALYAIVNGTLEEVFWRGTFMRRFPANIWLGVLYPAVLFSLWQLVPWAMNPAWLRVPVVAVIGVSLFMGLLYNWVAWRMGSIRWTVLAHVLTNLSGIGALLVFGPSF